MSSVIQLLMRWAVLALGVVLAAKIVPGIHCDDGATLLAVVVLLSLFNAFLKPILVLFTLPFIAVTLGLGMIVINALLFLFVGRLVNGFHVEGFGSAVAGSIVVSVTNILLSRLWRRPPPPPRNPPASAGGGSGGDVIDI
jgi:putative membrane protein